MDHTDAASDELERSLRELESMNRKFGGHRYVRKFLKKRLIRPGYRVLDLATGAADFPRVMVDWARARGIGLIVDAVDANPDIVALARKFSSDYPEIRCFESDILGFRSRRYYDLVHCSLTLHHFSAGQAVEVLKHCRDLSSEFVLVTDLERSALARVGVHAVNTILRHDGMTLQDGDMSARRAFSFREFRMLAKGAGWENFGHERFLFCRQALWLPGPKHDRKSARRPPRLSRSGRLP